MSDQNDDTETERVTISEKTARTALMEIEIAIKHTGGPEMDAERACSPLALVRQKVEATDALDGDAREHVITLLHEVSDERGVEISDADPLVDGTFQAQQELEKVLKDLSNKREH